MHKIFFHLIFFSSFLLRIPLSLLLVILRPIVPKIKSRIDFERLNLTDEASVSFKKDKVVADFLFHISSEGELEQSKPMIDYFLAKQKKVEIIYTSPSVEKKCHEIYKLNSKNVRLLRLPLLSYFPFDFLYFQSVFQFVTANKVIMCRYDFFPELLYLKYFNKKMFLISAATKKWSNYKKFCFHFFDFIIAATPNEASKIEKIVNCEVCFFEFRFLRIFERLDNLNQLIDSNETIKTFIQNINKIENEKLIIGSAWPSDLEIFNQHDFVDRVKNNQLKIVIAPHKLSAEFLEEILQKLGTFFPRTLVSIVNRENQKMDTPIVITLIPGMLCELYRFFDIAYVGGGFEKSIHSVLEPFLMGCKVLCGPKIHRSTEFDFISEVAANEIVVLNNSNLFYNKYNELKKDPKLFNRNSLRENSIDQFLEIIKKIELVDP